MEETPRKEDTAGDADVDSDEEDAPFKVVLTPYKPTWAVLVENAPVPFYSTHTTLFSNYINNHRRSPAGRQDLNAVEKRVEQEIEEIRLSKRFVWAAATGLDSARGVENYCGFAANYVLKANNATAVITRQLAPKRDHWFLLDTRSSANADKLVKCGYVVHTSRHFAVFFREVRGQDSKQRALVFLRPAGLENERGLLSEQLGKMGSKLLSREWVKLANSTAEILHDTIYVSTERERIGQWNSVVNLILTSGGQEYNARLEPSDVCSLCHSEDHKRSQCQWPFMDHEVTEIFQEPKLGLKSAPTGSKGESAGIVTAAEETAMEE